MGAVTPIQMGSRDAAHPGNQPGARFTKNLRKKLGKLRIKCDLRKSQEKLKMNLCKA